MSNLEKEESRLLNRPASVPKFGGGNPKCARCQKTVYANEKVVCASKEWHEACLKCPDCNKRLDATIVTEHDGEVYCKACYGRRFGPKGVGIGGVGVHADGGAPGTKSQPVVNPSPAYTPGVQTESVVSVSKFVEKVDVNPTSSAGTAFCPGCGTGCKGARFCSGCGNKLF